MLERFKVPHEDETRVPHDALHETVSFDIREDGRCRMTTRSSEPTCSWRPTCGGWRHTACRTCCVRTSKDTLRVRSTPGRTGELCVSRPRPRR